MPDELIPQEELTLTSEQIGSRPVRIALSQNSAFGRFQNVDMNQSDYRYWDQTRRGQTRGLEIAGLFLEPLVDKIASWTLGQAPRWSATGNARAEKRLNEWWGKSHSKIVRAWKEALALGDCYLVVNGDMSLTVVPPNMMTPFPDPDDYSKPFGWRLSRKIPHPIQIDKSQTVEDWFFPDVRYHVVRDGNGMIVGEAQKYPNPIGRVPVIKVSNLKGADEFFGRPEGAALLNLLVRYNDVLETALLGNIRQGRPTPVINSMGTMAQVTAFWEQFGRRETRTDPDTGEATTYYVIDFDPDTLMTLGGDAEFKYEAPGSFSQDTVNLLEIMFYLILQHSQVPEFIWGAAIGSSKASAESQIEPFVKWILKRRGEAMGWVSELMEVVTAYMSYYEYGMRSVQPNAIWRPIASSDGRLTLDTIIWAWTKGLIDDDRARWLLPVGADLSDQKTIERATAPPNSGDGADSTPASGGGDQQKFGYEKPIAPTERQMNDDEPVTEPGERSNGKVHVYS